MILKLGNKTPMIEENVFIGDTARVIGKVHIARGTSVWYGSILRGDVAPISIGEKTNIQDGCILHGEVGMDVVIGDRVTIGHSCVIHGCKIGDDTLIGMGSIITDGVVIPKNCFVSANSLITSKIGEIPEGSFIKGSPAKVVGKISKEQEKLIEDSYIVYFEKKDHYINELEIIK